MMMVISTPSLSSSTWIICSVKQNHGKKTNSSFPMLTPAGTSWEPLHCGCENNFEKQTSFSRCTSMHQHHISVKQPFPSSGVQLASFTIVPTLVASVKPSNTTSRKGANGGVNTVSNWHREGRLAKANAKFIAFELGTVMPVSSLMMLKSQTMGWKRSRGQWN